VYKVSGITFGVILLGVGLLGHAQDFQDLQKKVTDFTLPNGMRFVVAERHDIPVIAFRTHVGAGSVNDPAGATGLAHIFERIAFTGTETIGTTDAAAEKKALDALEEANDRVQAERDKGPLADELKIGSLQIERQKALDAARRYQTGKEFLHALDDGGFTALGTAVTEDFTQFQCAVPSNKAELWFLMESQRLLRPVFRNFYEERDAEIDDYRNHVESNSQAKLLQMLAAAAFTTHPYRNPVTGWSTDITELRQSDARQFFNRYYVPANITIAMAGDIAPDEARRLAERYFGPIPARPMPPAVHTREPAQTGPRTVTMEVATQPFVAVGFKRPDQYAQEDAAFDIIEMILGNRGGWLHKELVEGKRIASGFQVHATFPGGRYPHLFAFVLAVAPGHSAEESEKALAAVLTRLQNTKLDEATLDAAKTHARAIILRRLADNAGIADMLANFTAERGDWHKFLSTFEDLGKVTAQQVQIAALKYFVPSRRTTVYMVPPAAAERRAQ
jgi:predicted Zn-dependent peptidase